MGLLETILGLEPRAARKFARRDTLPALHLYRLEAKRRVAAADNNECLFIEND